MANQLKFLFVIFHQSLPPGESFIRSSYIGLKILLQPSFLVYEYPLRKVLTTLSVDVFEYQTAVHWTYFQFEIQLAAQYQQSRS